MIKQIKYVLWKLLFASAIVAAFSGFTISADGEKSKTSKENVLAANKTPDEKPVFRCPKKSFLTRAGCKEIKPVKTPTEIGKPQKSESVFGSNSGFAFPTGNRRKNS